MVKEMIKLFLSLGLSKDLGIKLFFSNSKSILQKVCLYLRSSRLAKEY